MIWGDQEELRPRMDQVRICITNDELCIFKMMNCVLKMMNFGSAGRGGRGVQQGYRGQDEEADCGREAAGRARQLRHELYAVCQ